MSLTQIYTVILLPEPEGGFTVRVPALPEVVTCGSDEGEALQMAKEAIELAVEHRLSRGEPLPEYGQAPVREVRVIVETAA